MQKKKKKRFYCIKGKTDDLLGGFIFYVNGYNLIIIIIKLRRRTIRTLVEKGDVSLRFLIM